jgi:hypothetical protein
MKFFAKFEVPARIGLRTYFASTRRAMANQRRQVGPPCFEPGPHVSISG